MNTKTINKLARQVWSFEIKSDVLVMKLTVTEIKHGIMSGISEDTKDIYKVFPYEIKGLFDNLSSYSKVMIGHEITVLPRWDDRTIAHFVSICS